MIGIGRCVEHLRAGRGQRHRARVNWWMRWILRAKARRGTLIDKLRAGAIASVVEG